MLSMGIRMLLGRSALLGALATLLSAPAPALLYTVDSDLGDPGFQSFILFDDPDDPTFSVRFDPVTDVSGIFTPPLDGTVSDPDSQDWVVFSATVLSVDTSILQLGLGIFDKTGIGAAHYPADAGVAADSATAGGTTVFHFGDGDPPGDGLLTGEFTVRLIVAFADGSFTPPSHSGVNFMVFHEGAGVFSGPTNIALVPEPATALLLGLALAALGATRRKPRS